MEKLIHIGLNSWIDGLSIKDKLFAKRRCGIDRTLRVLQMSKDILKLKDNIFFVIYSCCINAYHLVSEVFDEKQLLKQGVDVASCC